jgi:hypothetical protein
MPDCAILLVDMLPDRLHELARACCDSTFLGTLRLHYVGYVPNACGKQYVCDTKDVRRESTLVLLPTPLESDIDRFA